jgi:hypothetical protein
LSSKDNFTKKVALLQENETKPKGTQTSGQIPKHLTIYPNFIILIATFSLKI